MSTSNKQAGFSIVEGVIAVFVIVLLGVIGWSVYNYYSSKPAKVASQTTSQTNGPLEPATTTSQTTQTVDPNAGYVVIKEWGVRFKPVNGLTNLEYSIRPFDNDSAADFTTTQINAIDSHCDPSQPGGFSGIGSITRISTSEQQPPSGPADPLLATLNSYNYYGAYPQATCLRDSSNTVGAATISDTETKFFNSIKTLQAAQ